MQFGNVINPGSGFKNLKAQNLVVGRRRKELEKEDDFMVQENLSRLKIDKTRFVYRSQRGKRFVYWITGAALLLLVVLLYNKRIFTPEVEVANVSRIYPSQAFTLLNASGYVVAQRKAAVASKITGRIVSLMVEEGARVKKDDVIARLESDDVKAARDQADANLSAAIYRLDQAKAELADATAAFARNKQLLHGQVVSQAEYDAFEARYKKAIAAVAAADALVKANRAALAGANVAIGYTLIRAPFDAVVLTKSADIGDIVTPIGAAADAKAAVVTIADMESLQVEVDVSESNLGLVRTEQPCEIQLDALPDSRFPGKVYMIVPTADRTKATVLVKVRFLNQDLRILPEMSAKVAFLSRKMKDNEQKPLTAISPAAIEDQNGKKFVYRISGNRLEKIPVTLGKKLGDMIEVLEGVKAGDMVVLKPLQKMRDGRRIKVVER